MTKPNQPRIIRGVTVHPGECLIVRCANCDTPNAYHFNFEDHSGGFAAEHEGVELPMRCAECGEHLRWYDSKVSVQRIAAS